jgi:hypothetical protein
MEGFPYLIDTLFLLMLALLFRLRSHFHTLLERGKGSVAPN